MAIKNGDKVKVKYIGTLEDGTVFDSSDKHGQPLEFEVGSGQIIKGFDAAVIGMKKGDQKDITLQPKDAYGYPSPNLMKKIPRAQFPKDQQIEPGMMLMIRLPDNREIPARIAIVDDNKVTLDLNHPLAGKVLKFHIEVV